MAAYASWAPKEFDQEAAEAPADAPTTQTDAAAAEEHTYQYDAESGYYYDTASGMYYDANTSLFYDGNKQAWCRYDEASKTYEPVWNGDPEPQRAEAAAPEPKRGAVIGGAPALNPHGVRAALEAAEEKVQQQKQTVQGVVRGGKGKKWSKKAAAAE